MSSSQEVGVWIVDHTTSAVDPSADFGLCSHTGLLAALSSLPVSAGDPGHRSAAVLAAIRMALTIRSRPGWSAGSQIPMRLSWLELPSERVWLVVQGWRL